MTPKRKIREVTIAPRALTIMESFSPTEKEKAVIRNVIEELGREDIPPKPSPTGQRSGPWRGYRIAFLEPPTYRIDVGRFNIQYRFDDYHVYVGYIGVYA